MKKMMFLLFAFLFNARASRQPKKSRVGLVSMHNANFFDGLYEVEREFSKRGVRDFVKLDRTDLRKPLTALKFCFYYAYQLGGCEYIFLNDNFMPLAYLKPNSDMKIVQIWHGQGAFKKFGLDIPRPEKVRKREIAANEKLTHLVCSSRYVRHIYASAFGVSKEKVYCTGSPNEDYYFRHHDVLAIREAFNERYPTCANKLLVLYAPTFRDDPIADAAILDGMDFKRLKASFSCQVEVLVRLHPQIHKNIEIKGAVDVTDYENVNELCLISDLLITDYSSICMDFSLMDKPMIFYPFDLDKYTQDRDFYFEYESYVPGAIAKNLPELCKIIETENFQTEKNVNFKDYNFGVTFGSATSDFIDCLEKEEKLGINSQSYENLFIKKH